MKAKTTAFLLLAALLIAPACGGGGDGGAPALELNDPIGAPERSDAAPDASLSQDTSVIKTASIEMDVAKPNLNAAAQEVVDIATSDIIGGFLVSSVVDTNEGFGSAQVVVNVPSMSFEKVVGDLNTVGDVSRQELEGKDMTSTSLALISRQRRGRAQLASQLRQLKNSDDPGVRSDLRTSIGYIRGRLARLENNKAYIEHETSFSTIDVAIAGRQPAPPPEKPALERSLATAKTITERIGAAFIIAAGVVIPLALFALVIYLLSLPIIKRVKLRMASSG